MLGSFHLEAFNILNLLHFSVTGVLLSHVATGTLLGTSLIVDHADGNSARSNPLVSLRGLPGSHLLTKMGSNLLAVANKNVFL